MAFAVKYMAAMTSAGGTDGINSMALQQPCVGLLLSTLIITASPMAAAFFQGTLGQFASYSSFGNVGSQLGGQDQQAIAQGRQAPNYTPAPLSNDSDAGRRGQGHIQPHTQMNSYGDTALIRDDVKTGTAPTRSGDSR